MQLRLDPAALTVGDMEDFEAVAGTEILEVFTRMEVAGLTALPLAELKALLWILRRHENPDYTLEDTRNITLLELGQIEIEVGGLAAVPAGS